MSRNKVLPFDRVLIHIPIDLRAKMSLELYSELEGRIPYGKQSALIAQLLREHFESERLDLQPFGFPEGYFVKGPKAMIEKLRTWLQYDVDRMKETV